jgi:hypothetical protein
MRNKTYELVLIVLLFIGSSAYLILAKDYASCNMIPEKGVVKLLTDFQCLKTSKL